MFQGQEGDSSHNRSDDNVVRQQQQGGLDKVGEVGTLNSYEGGVGGWW